MALQIKKGTNEQRALYTPLVGELLYVTDHVQAGVDPIYVGDGLTLGGVAVGQNAVLSGNLEGDINLFGNDIVGAGDINHTGNITTKKVTITGNTEIVGGDSVVVAISSTGSVSIEGNVSIDGDIISTGAIQSASIESDLTGSVISSDSTQILVDATTNQFSGSSITLSSNNSNLVISASSIIHNPQDPTTLFNLGSTTSPISFSKYEVQGDERNGRFLVDPETGGTSSAGLSFISTQRGDWGTPENIQQHDTIGGFIYGSYNNAVTGPSPEAAKQGIAGIYMYVAEDQTGAQEGIVPSTFVLGSGLDAALSASDPVTNLLTSNNNSLLKYTSMGVLKVKSIQLNRLTMTERNLLNSSLAEGSMVFVTNPTDSSGDPIGAPRLQLKVGTEWFNISMTAST
jgi:hypothetical protein